jgi:hypothetical protein
MTPSGRLDELRRMADEERARTNTAKAAVAEAVKAPRREPPQTRASLW